MEHFVFISYSSADKYIADAICHQLEDAGIRCWIAPRDIGNSDWATAIMKGLHQSDVFVVIVSQNSINSPEVTKEVTEATRCCSYILPFKVDKEELNDRLQYHLGPCHWLDAVTPPLEQRIDELKQRIWGLADEDAIYMNHNRWRLSSHTVYPRAFFVGRESEIEQIRGMLLENHVLFLQGMGGIGKSEIAKGYAKTYQDYYDTIIFAGYQSNIMDMIIGDDIQIENFKRNTTYGEDAESPEAFFRRKIEVFKKLSSDRTLLIVDNFDVDEDEFLVELVNGPYHIIFTTRNEHCDYPTLTVGKIQDYSKVRQIFTTNYGRALPEKDMAVVDEILQLVNCHTITVELIAKQMKASFLKAEKMLSLLKEGGVNTNLKEKVKREGSNGSHTAFDFIRELFHLSDLSEEEQYVMQCMCMVPFTGIEVPLFGDFLELEDFDIINSLLAKSWLMLDEETNYIKMHPIICDVVKEQLRPTINTCQKYIINLWKVIKNAWFMPVEERMELWPYVKHLLEKYPEPTLETWRQYAAFGDIAWICGDFRKAIDAGHTSYIFAVENFGTTNKKTSFAARLLAGAYYNAGDDASAEPYFKLAAEHHLACKEQDLIELGITYSKVGRCAYMNHDFETAKKYLSNAVNSFEKMSPIPVDRKKSWICGFGDTLVYYERMYIEMGDYNKALEYCQKSYDVFYSFENCEMTNNVYSLVDMGICYSALCDYDKADCYLQRALALNIKMNGESSMVTVRTREAIADNFVKQGNIEEAKRLYLTLELELERSFGADNPQVTRLQEKLNKIN